MIVLDMFKFDFWILNLSKNISIMAKNVKYG